LGLKFKESEVGLIPEDWNINELKSRAIITMGQSPKSDTYNNVKIGIPFMQGRKTFGDKYPHIDTWCTDPKRIAKKNDVLISVRAPVGDVNIAVEDICIGRGLASLRMKNGNNEFLYYLLKNYVGEITSRGTGTVFASIDKEGLETLKLPFPSDLEQKAIAHILSTLDEKIETNNQINEKLEEMAQALFKHWFVDFEFPNENGEPYKSSGGEMVESELGMIPKGWEVGKLGDIISISSGKRPKEKQADSSEKYPFPIVGASSIMGYTSDFNYNEPVLIIGRVGTHGIIQRFTNKLWASDNTLVIKSKYYGFTYNILKSIDYKSLNRGSTQPLITQKDIKNTTVLIPPSNLVNSYEDFYSSLFEKYRTNKVESDLLTKIRETILPKLMSGEIRVPLDHEEFVEQR
jgi:type I restriction enzyme, S subunit